MPNHACHSEFWDNFPKTACMLQHGKDVGFQAIKLSLKTMSQVSEDLFLYQKLWNSQVTKYFNIMTVQK